MIVRAVADGEVLEANLGGDRWLLSWHNPAKAPEGTAHGSAAMCVTTCSHLVLITNDGERWGAPGGRPEPGETIEETLQREVLEEACALVVKSRLLGFSLGRCIEGRERGVSLVRSLWRADVELEEWNPRFETRARRIEPAPQAWTILQAANRDTAALYRRWFEECGVRSD